MGEMEIEERVRIVMRTRDTAKRIIWLCKCDNTAVIARYSVERKTLSLSLVRRDKQSVEEMKIYSKIHCDTAWLGKNDLKRGSEIEDEC